MRYLTYGLWPVLALLSGCAAGVAAVGQGHIKHVAHRNCEQMPSMEQRNQCLRNFDTTTPGDTRPQNAKTPELLSQEDALERARKQREALCIRREGQAPLCPN